MCDDDSRLVIDDNEANCSADNTLVAPDGQKANKSFNDLHKRHSVSPSLSSSSSSSGSSSTSSSSNASCSLNGQLEKHIEKQQPIRKRKKEVAPRKANENAKAADTESANKKQKAERTTRTTANKHCQTEDLQQQPLKANSNVLLDVTIVFAPDPNTLFFTTKWRGRSYTGVITDGLSCKNQFFGALKRERTDRQNGKSSGGVQNGQSPSLKPRGKRAFNRGGVIDRKSRNEELSIFDKPDDEIDTKPAKLIKVQDGEAQKMFTRCPHKQCGHLFETVNEVNHHLLFSHVEKPAIIKETTASQYSPIASSSTGTDPIPELKKSSLCTKCREPVVDKKPGDQKKGTTSPCYSDVSAEDDAPTLIKEDSFEKNDESRQQSGLNYQQTSILGTKLPTPNSSGTNPPANTANSLTPRRTETNVTSKAASNSSTPAPTSSTPLPNKQRTALTPNIIMSQAAQQPRLIAPPPNFGLSFTAQSSAQQHQQALNNQQQLLNLMNIMNASAALQQSTASAPVKAGGSITAGSSSFSNLPQTTINLPGTSTINSGGIGIHPLAVLNGLGTSTPTSSAQQNDATRHKIHELKTGENLQNAQANLLGVSNMALQQQQRNASPNTANVMASTNNIPRGQQQLPFVRPPTSLAPNPAFSFLQRVPGVLPHQAPFMNPAAQLSQMFGLGGMPPLQQQPK
ncbi:hypothetical protein M3Y97_00420400 [Aphelenchoides bicaudatus]|nr:hypothetical protein M3Y97_00420400 [Aphelenchoides bicaudatus]